MRNMCLVNTTRQVIFQKTVEKIPRIKVMNEKRKGRPEFFALIQDRAIEELNTGNFKDEILFRRGD